MKATLRSWSQNWLRGLDMDFVTYSTRKGWKRAFRRRDESRKPVNYLLSLQMKSQKSNGLALPD